MRIASIKSPSILTAPVGVIIGVSAALISIITAWLSDIKMGHCTTGWWISRKFCCLELSDEMEACAEWKNWGGVEPFGWIAYVLFAVSICFRPNNFSHVNKDYHT